MQRDEDRLHDSDWEAQTKSFSRQVLLAVDLVVDLSASQKLGHLRLGVSELKGRLGQGSRLRFTGKS